MRLKSGGRELIIGYQFLIQNKRPTSAKDRDKKTNWYYTRVKEIRGKKFPIKIHPWRRKVGKIVYQEIRQEKRKVGKEEKEEFWALKAAIASVIDNIKWQTRQQTSPNPSPVFILFFVSHTNEYFFTPQPSQKKQPNQYFTWTKSHSNVTRELSDAHKYTHKEKTKIEKMLTWSDFFERLNDFFVVRQSTTTNRRRTKFFKKNVTWIS